MFGGTERRRSSNVRYKQLFHELKQQFPTIPDEVIANCILEQANSISVKKSSSIIEALRANVSSRSSSEEPMGRSSSQSEASYLAKVDTPGSAVGVPENIQPLSPRKKSSGSHKLQRRTRTHNSNDSPDQTERTNPESENSNRKREKRDKLSSLLKRSTRATKIPLKLEHSYSKRYISKLATLKTRIDSDESSSRETTPSEQDETEIFPTVSALRQQFESSQNVVNNNTCTTSKSKSSSPSSGSEMNHNVTVTSSDLNQVIKGNSPNGVSPRRPNSLDLTSTTKQDSANCRNSIKLSEKCNNLPKLLNSNILSDKPPRSPVHNKKITNAKTKNVSSTSQEVRSISSPNGDKENFPTNDSVNVNKGAIKKETVSTPTQTTDSLLGEEASGSVNLSFNVNCSMDVIHSPVTSRRTSVLQVTPEIPWGLREPTSPRSYTSVNLTLRPPSSTPQPPIDITSQNASLTYSTSSFDSQKGLQSRLQITVGPTGGNVTASRVRPKSQDFDATSENKAQFDVPAVGSPKDMVENEEPPVIVRQQARIERLRIELTNEKTRLIVLKKEVEDLENKTKNIKTFAEVQRQELKLKIDHLSYQCRKLFQDLNCFSEPEFYNNLYRGQPLGGINSNNRTQPNVRASHPGTFLQQDPDDPKWSCHICTFLNHPELNKCEQCEMPRLIHVSAAPGDNIHIHVSPRLSSRFVRSWLL